MNAKQIGLTVLLADFVAFTGYVVYHYGYVGLFEAAMANAATMQVFFDLCIALSCFVFWMWKDAQARQISPLPYMLLVLTTGSIGALAYLIRRESSAPATVATPHLATRAVSA